MNLRARIRTIFSSCKIPGTVTYYSTADILHCLYSLSVRPLRCGAVVDRFEQRLARWFHSPGCAVLPSCRISLYYVLKSLCLPADSEVLLTPVTITDMVNMIRCSGLTPRFVDMDPGTVNISIDSLKKKITGKSRVLLITYLYGVVPENLGEILAVASEHNLIVIEDISQAWGCTYNGNLLGTLGYAGVCSLSSFKTCSTLFGGFVISTDREIINSIRQSSRRLPLPGKGIFISMAVKILVHNLLMKTVIFPYVTFYIMRCIHGVCPGFHYRLQTGNIGVILGFDREERYDEMKKELLFSYTDMQADMGLRHLSRLPDRLRVLKTYSRLLNRVRGISRYIPSANAAGESIYWRFPLNQDQLPGIKRRCFYDNIEISYNLLPVCTDFLKLKSPADTDDTYTGSRLVHTRYVLLPVHSSLSPKKMVYLVHCLHRILKKEG